MLLLLVVGLLLLLVGTLGVLARRKQAPPPAPPPPPLPPLPVLILSKEEVKKPKLPPAPTFPYLAIKNLVPQGLPTEFQPNTRSPIAFSCDTCEGKMVLMLRTPGSELDPHYLWAFEHKKRYFELHCQLQLKVEPTSVLYLGGEVPRKMNLGMMANMACYALLAIIRKLAPTGHFSMGGGGITEGGGGELPHIVFPLWHAADRMIITKPGQPLPVIGQGPLFESNETREARFKDQSLGRGVFKLGDTITFSFHSAYMDLVEWKVRGLGRDQSLSMFWDTMPLRVVLYELPPSSQSKKHVNLSYYLLFELKNTLPKAGEQSTAAVLYEDEDEVGEHMQELTSISIASSVEERTYTPKKKSRLRKLFRFKM
ncbi:hypothetical protein BASA81_008811 [Batrachochytrium salamandrivorans]|nr:hypothetical protein BASA81_008811 [Batrachochytrium salamandrivorans]